MNKKKLLAAVIIFLIALIFFKKNSSNDWQQVAKVLLTPVTKNLIQKYDLILCGTGGKMSEDCTYIKFVFQIFRPITMGEAKEILVNSSEEYIQAILSSSKFLSFMPNSEFKPKYLELEFFVSGIDGFEVYDPYVSVFSFEGESVSFVFKEAHKRYEYKEINISYEEVKAQVEGI